MSSAILGNIQAQPDALRAVAAHQLGPGKDALLRAAASLNRSERIVFTGMGGSLCACIPAQYLFAERGIPVTVIDSAELLYFASGILSPKTAVVLVSRSGESIEITKLLPVLRERGCPLISITNVPGSTLTTHADVNILINSPSDQLIAIQTYTATLAVISLLAAACFGALEIAGHDLQLTIGAIEQLSSAGVAAQTIFERRPIYLLGRGASLASVNAGVLLMHEMARLPAVGMSCAQFRHGPVEVVTRDFQAIIFGTQSSTAEIDGKLAENLSSTGASVGWIGPIPANTTVRALCSWPAFVPPRFAPILEIIPVQILCLRLAELGGIPAGQFQFAAPITLSETEFITSNEPVEHA
jgi:glutamine---fructose-6-phosphate transaminase (isomerizing)